MNIIMSPSVTGNVSSGWIGNVTIKVDGHKSFGGMVCHHRGFRECKTELETTIEKSRKELVAGGAFVIVKKTRTPKFI